MILFPKLKNPVLNKLSDDCGLTLDFDEPAVTSKEIEFFAEQLIKDCIAEFNKYSTVDLAIIKVKEHFGVE